MNNRKVIVFLLALVLGLAWIANNKATAQYNAPIAYAQILEMVERNSIYELSKAELTALSECILNRAFISINIPKNAELGKDFLMQSCFAKDKHAGYESPVQVKLEQAQRTGKFSGIGIEIGLSEDGQGAVVKGIIDGGPVAKSGLLKEGDLIIAAGNNPKNMRSFVGFSVSDIVVIIRGKIGTAVTLEVVRGGNKLPLIAITRGEVKLISVEFRKLDSGIGYLRLRSFFKINLIEEDVLPALLRLANDGVDRLVIDLRGNPGGLVRNAEQFAEVFAPKDNAFIIEIRGREEGETYASEHFGEKFGLYSGWKTVILVDGKSASASELVAGVMQIWGSKIFGEKTYGKGSMQSVFSLADGGRFKLTTAKWYFSNGKTPDGVGIIPDFAIAKDPNDEKRDAVLEEAVKYLKNFQ